MYLVPAYFWLQTGWRIRSFETDPEQIKTLPVQYVKKCQANILIYQLSIGIGILSIFLFIY